MFAIYTPIKVLPLKLILGCVLAPVNQSPMTRRKKLRNLEFLLAMEHRAFWSGVHSQLVPQRPKLSARRAGLGNSLSRGCGGRQSALGITVPVASIRATRFASSTADGSYGSTTSLSRPVLSRSALPKTRPNLARRRIPARTTGCRAAASHNQGVGRPCPLPRFLIPTAAPV
jgi:hypothetical protein